MREPHASFLLLTIAVLILISVLVLPRACGQDTIPERLTRIETQMLELNEMVNAANQERPITADWRGRMETKMDTALYGGILAILGIVTLEIWQRKKGG